MTKIIISLVFLFSSVAFASENCQHLSNEQVSEEVLEIKSDVPEHLKGATIIVKLADGRESQVPAEQFKVVKRRQQFIVTKVKQTDKLLCKADLKKNRVSVLAGNGPKEGLETTKHPSKVTVETDVGFVGGLQYQRLLNDRISVGGQVQSNESVFLNIGLDF